MLDKKIKDLYNDLFTTLQQDLITGFDPEAEKLKQELDERLNQIFRDGADASGDLSSSVSSDKRASSGSEKEAAQQAEQQAPKEPETDPMEDLDSLIGLDAIKHDVKELFAYVKIQKMRSDSGLKTAPLNLHLVFTGNPGTGKTTVARIIARLYKQIGVLSKGQLVEVDRSGLVAGYVGQTAIKTQEKIQEALGGVLFIDEAYALAKEGNDFGQEAIDTILKAMEDNRDDFVVIVAGYTEPMEKFINSNPGLKSRFNKYISFADYTIEELTAIFESYCKKYDYIIDEENLNRVSDLLRLKKVNTPDNFANAREARNLFEEIITNQARRLNAMPDITLDDMRTIAYEDLFDKQLSREEATSSSDNSDTSAQEDSPEAAASENANVPDNSPEEE